VNRRTAPFSIGTPVFNIYSLSVGKFVRVWTPQTRLGEYTTALAVVKVVMKGNRIRRVRWRLDNCRRYTPRALLSRTAFLLLSRTLDISPQRLRPRVKLTHYGFTRGRRRDFCDLLRRRCKVTLSRRALGLRMTASQVVATVLAAKKR
jgi:hypothetical protein